MICRSCNSKNFSDFCDLGYMPPSNDYLYKKDIYKSQIFYPLKVIVCEHCKLAQTHDFIKPNKLFKNDYSYLSGESKTWINHIQKYEKKIKQKLNLNKKDLIVEVASNDGALIGYFKNVGYSNILGIEPTRKTANIAKKKGLKVINNFFTTKLVNQYKLSKKAKLIIANNVYAHVPKINNFTKAIKSMLHPEGYVTIEFQHLKNIISKNQFDTIYHEHFSYLSLIVVDKIFNQNNLKVFDAEKISTHGGSLRVYGCLKNRKIKKSLNYFNIINDEIKFGIRNLQTYKNYQLKCNKIKNDLCNLLYSLKKNHFKIYAYGAAAKGNTLLNFCGLDNNIIDYVFDKSALKQNKYLPGSKIKIIDPLDINKHLIDYLIILPWNLSNEIMKQIKDTYTKKNIKFIIPVPKVKIVK